MKVLKTIQKVLKSVRKSLPPESLHHPETSKPTRSADQMASFNTTQA